MSLIMVGLGGGERPKKKKKNLYKTRNAMWACGIPSGVFVHSCACLRLQLCVRVGFEGSSR